MPWSPVWSRLLETDPFDVPAAKEARDFMLTLLSNGFCPACRASDFGPYQWTAGEECLTVVCTVCEIVWPPRFVLERMDFDAEPQAAPLMGDTIREITRLATVIQKRRPTAT